MKEFRITDHGNYTGAIEDSVDSRDYHLNEIGRSSTPFDWSVGYDIESQLKITLPVKDQGQSYSCGGQAWSSYMNVLSTKFEGKLEDHSAKFIYAQTVEIGGGSAGRKNCDLVIKQGDCRETVLPSYEYGNPPSEWFMTDKLPITDEVRKDASTDKALSYAQGDSDIESVACAIRDNYGCVIGIYGVNNGTWRSYYPVPPKSDDKGVWAHWVYAGKAKIVDGKKYIGILNSWGKGVGQSGWQWIGEDYFSSFVGGRSAIFSVWALVYNPVTPSLGFKHTFNQELTYGMLDNPEVKALQTALQLMDFYPKNVPCTGNYMDITRKAVYDFQNRYIATDYWSSMVVWWNKGKNVSNMTNKQLNRFFMAS